MTAEAVRVLQAVAGIHGYKFEFAEHAIGGVAIREFGSPLPRTTLDACLASDAVLLGAVGAPEYDRLPANQRPEAGLLLLRRALGGYANLRPAKAYAAIAGVRRCVTRSRAGLTFYSCASCWVVSISASRAVSRPRQQKHYCHNTMQYSVEEIERVARVAFEAAQKRRGKVTSVDKANVLETSQLWRQTVTRVAEDYPTLRSIISMSMRARCTDHEPANV